MKEILKPCDVEQLFLYFAGHGVNIHRREYWLLSDAENDPQEAVNVTGSEDLTRYCGIPHIVFISDACRTVATTLRAQSITGSEMFPICEAARKPVDQFFACALGTPSSKIADADTTAREFKAAYTGELLPALSGKVPSFVEWVSENGKNVGYVPLVAGEPSRDRNGAAACVSEAEIAGDSGSGRARGLRAGGMGVARERRRSGVVGGLVLGPRQGTPPPAPFTSTPLIGTALNRPAETQEVPGCGAKIDNRRLAKVGRTQEVT